METRYGSKTKCRLLHVEAFNILLMAVAQNMRTLTRVRTQRNEEIFVIVWIFSTKTPRNLKYELANRHQSDKLALLSAKEAKIMRFS